MTTPTQAHNLAAVERALASGHKAVWVGDHYLVPSRSHRGRMYAVTVRYTTVGVSISCDCEAGRSQAPVGSSPCWHGALAMVEEQADDRAVFTGERWTAQTTSEDRCVNCKRPIVRHGVEWMHRPLAPEQSAFRYCSITPNQPLSSNPQAQPAPSAPAAGFVSSLPKCPTCGLDVDRDCLLPVEFQPVELADGQLGHRGCAQ